MYMYESQCTHICMFVCDRLLNDNNNNKRYQKKIINYMVEDE